MVEKIIDILKLGTTRILHLIGFYLSFLLVTHFKSASFNVIDLLTPKGIETVVLCILIYFVTYVLIYTILYLALINFADWYARMRIKNIDYAITKARLDALGRYISFVTKTPEVESGQQMAKAITVIYQYSLLVMLLLLQLAILLNNIWCWVAFTVVSLFAIGTYFSIFLLRQFHQLYLLENDVKNSEKNQNV